MTKFAWRASGEFADAIRKHHVDRQTAIDSDVIHGWNEAHPDHHLAFQRRGLSLDVVPRGFFDGTPQVPEGLSRAQTREYLLPLRGKKGAPWKDALDAAKAALPSLDDVFKAHGVPVYVMGDYAMHTVGMFDAGEHIFITCNADILGDKDCPHATPVKLSEYYAAKEACTQPA